jgi:hypothetical protein
MPHLLRRNVSASGKIAFGVLPKCEGEGNLYSPLNIFRENDQILINIAMEKYSKKRMAIGMAGCLGAFFIQLILGSSYQWGIINVFVTSFYKIRDPSLTLEGNEVIFPLLMICGSITITPGLLLYERFHPILLLMIIEVLQAVFVFASSYVEEFSAFIVLFGVLFGLISGFSFMIPVV